MGKNNHLHKNEYGPERVISFGNEIKYNEWMRANYDSIMIIERKIGPSKSSRLYVVFYRLKDSAEIVYAERDNSGLASPLARENNERLRDYGPGFSGPQPF